MFNVDPENGLTLIEIADGVSVQEIVEATECGFEVGYTRSLVFSRIGRIENPSCEFEIDVKLLRACGSPYGAAWYDIHHIQSTLCTTGTRPSDASISLSQPGFFHFSASPTRNSINQSINHFIAIYICVHK